MRKLLFTALLLACVVFTTTAQGYLKRSGKTIVKGDGTEFLLRGIGLGGWMLMEPYMFQISNAGTQHQIKDNIKALIGADNADTFYTAWINNFITKADVDSMAKFGFNSIRLPMHYNLYTLPIEQEPVAGGQTWLETGFNLTDSLLSWCKANNMYLILDLHAAPGGQGKDAAISDYDDTKPSLWESDANKAKMIAFWQKMAARYKDEPNIGAYDLLNEPNWDFENSGNKNGCNCKQNAPLLNLYKDIIAAIRAIDTKHLVIVEGNCWGNNYAGFSDKIAAADNNLAFSFHKYWNENTTGAISGQLAMRNTLNTPIWCGESGENSNNWYTNSIQLLESNNIGWAWWTWKKLESINSSNSIKANDGYTKLNNYWKGTAPKPSVDAAKAALLGLANNLKMANVTVNHSVMDAMLRQPSTTEVKPFKRLTIPGLIHASDYDYGRNNIAYADIDTADYHSSSGTYTNWNSGWAYRNDGVDIEPCKDNDNSNGFNVGWMNPGEWLQYTVTADSTMAYKLSVRFASQNTSTILHIAADGKDITGPLKLAATGGWATFATTSFDNIIVPKGKHALRLYTDEGGGNVSYFQFVYATAIGNVPFKAVSAGTSADGSKIFINTNMEVMSVGAFNASEFMVTVDGANIPLTNLAIDVTTGALVVDVDGKIAFGNTVTISYTGHFITNIADSALEPFASLAVKNNLPTRFILPAKVEAEAFHFQTGLSVEKCDEGGSDIGYTNAGDYLDYLVTIPQAGKYSANLRVASTGSSGKAELLLIDAGNQKTSLGIISIPSTGGWQVWKTTSVNVDLPKGEFTLRLLVKNPEFNINWLSFADALAITNTRVESFGISPNPANDYIMIEWAQNTAGTTASIADLSGRILLKASLSTNNIIDVSNLKNGIYLLSLNDSHANHTEKFNIAR